jgi:methylthioribose-1-phosphate isomerase
MSAIAGISGVETLRWRDGRIEMIDQRLLPSRFEYVACGSAAEVAAAIRSMVIRGAPAIGCAAAYGVALAALGAARLGADAYAKEIAEAIVQLGESRPTAVNLFWALRRMQSLANRLRDSGLSPAASAQALLDEAHAIVAEDIAINRRLGGFGATLLADGARVMTHCNAGALATAGHGTALGIVRSARDAGKRITVIACETRPYLQGARLTAWEMVQEAIPVTLIADNAAGHLMSRGEIDAVIVGCDRVAANGDTANKIGTYMHAVLAKRHGIPFYVACPLSTLDLALADGSGIPIEQRSAEEVLGYGGERWAPAGVAVSNPAFDVTPAELISAIVTEQGIAYMPYHDSLASLAPAVTTTAKST